MNKLLLIILLLGLVLRFLYFPENVYFGYDQARDAYESQSIYKEGNIKIIGPSTSSPDLFHGPLYWYLIGPWYVLGQGNPIYPAAFLLVLNALGILVIFYLGSVLFSPLVGVIASYIYSVSFEQTQYALYFGNPTPAVLTIALYYLGLSIFVFKKLWWGLPFALFFLGLSIHFEFFLLYQILPGIILLLLFYNKRIFSSKVLISSIISFSFSLGTFILAEIKFNFRTTRTLFSTVKTVGAIKENIFKIYFTRFTNHISHNIFGMNETMSMGLFISLLVIIGYFVITKRKSKELVFCSIWFFSTLFFLIFGIPSMYYADIGIAAAIILIVAYFLSLLFKRHKVLFIIFLTAILISNIALIANQNKKGIINDIYVQEGMLLAREKKAIDYIYQNSDGKPIVVSALTMPLKVNTTWAYLFNWYGKKKYGYVPYWAGESASGFPGSLPEWKSQEKDYTMFTIKEPVRGVREAFINDFLLEQEQYGAVSGEVILGDIWYAQLIIQRRK